jgi:hypothetical protein
MTEYRIRLEIPLFPVRGDRVDVEGESPTSVDREFARLSDRRNVFAIAAADGHFYEVSPASTESNVWTATRRLEPAAFKQLGPSTTFG